MPRPRTSDALLRADEVRDLIDRAGTVLEDVSLADLYDGDESESVDADRRLTIGLEAYRFALRNAQALADPQLLDAVLETLDINPEVLWDDEGILHEIFPEVLTSLIARVRGPEPLIDALISNETVAVRAAVAAGLRPRTRWARAHLVTLAHDFWPSVRVRAQTSLRTKREVPEWWGRFDTDPVAGLSASQAEELRPKLEALREHFDDSDWKLGESVRSGKLLKALEALPLPLAAGLAEKVARADLQLFGKPLGLFPLALQGPDGAGFLVRWLSGWKDSEEFHIHQATELAEAWRSLPTKLGQPLRTTLVERLHHPDDELFLHPGFRERAAQLLGPSWPKDLDPTPLLDLILEQPQPTEGSRFCSELARAFRQAEALPDAFLTRLVEAQQAGWPGRWSEIRSAVEPQLERLPVERLRPLAEKAALNPDDRVASWALNLLLTQLHQPKRDGSQSQHAAEAWKDPRWRRLLIAHHSRLVVPLLRTELRAGTLTLAEATTAVSAINLFYGGLGAPPLHLRVNAEHADGFHRHYREPYRDLLGAKSLQGAVTPAEWKAFREVRARDFEALFANDANQASLAVQFTPPGPEWDPEDRALFWRGVKLCWATKSEELALALMTLMALKPLREDVLILERLHRIDAQGAGAGRNLRAEIRTALGLDEVEDDDEPDEDPAGAPAAE